MFMFFCGVFFCVCVFVKTVNVMCLHLLCKTLPPLTFLCQRRVGLILVHQQLDLFWFERRVENLVQPRVPLLAVDELRHLLHRQVWPALCPPEGRDGDTFFLKH